MIHTENYIGAALVVLIVTCRYAGISSALKQNSNVTTCNQTEDRTGIIHNLTLRNGSLENCDVLAANNISTVGENFTSTVLKSLTNESQFPHGNFAIVVTSSLAICLGIWSVVTNSLPVAAIIKQEHLHKPVYIFMANLAASDVLTGIAFVFTGSFIIHLIDNETVPSPLIARLHFTTIFLSGLSSAYSLMVLTAERYWFIVHGMTYVNNVTNDKCKVVIVIVWVWCLLIAMLPIFGWHCEAHSDGGCLSQGGGLPYGFMAILMPVFVFIPMADIILFNMGVFRCLWIQVNAINGQEAAVGAPPSVGRKSAITIVLITVLFLVGWLPLFIKMAVVPEDFAPYLFIFIILNSAINPVIYGFRLGEVRRGVLRLFVNNNGNAIFPVN